MITIYALLGLTGSMWLKACFLVAINRERKDLKDQLEEMVFRDLWVFQDLEDLLDPLERMETR